MEKGICTAGEGMKRFRRRVGPGLDDWDVSGLAHVP